MEMQMKIRESGEEELRRFLEWIVKNPEDWRHICDPGFFQLEISEISDLIGKLEKAGFLTVAYLVFNYADYKSAKMERARTQIVNQALVDIPISKLMEQIRKNLEGVM